MRQVDDRQPALATSGAETAPGAADVFGAYFEMMTAIQSAMLSGMVAGTENKPATNRTTEPEPRLPEPAGGNASWSTSEARSWYRRPVETPFGSYMHGSGMFVPGGVMAAFAEAVWQPQAEQAMRWMAQNPGLATQGLAAFTPSMAWPYPTPAASLPAMMPMLTGPVGWNPVAGFPAHLPSTPFEAHGAAMTQAWSSATGLAPAMALAMFEMMTAMMQPLDGRALPERQAAAPDRQAGALEPQEATAPLRQPDEFVSYRTSGGHAVANVVPSKGGETQAALLPFALALTGWQLLAGLVATGGPNLS